MFVVKREQIIGQHATPGPQKPLSDTDCAQNTIHKTEITLRI